MPLVATALRFHAMKSRLERGFPVSDGFFTDSDPLREPPRAGGIYPFDESEALQSERFGFENRRFAPQSRPGRVWHFGIGSPRSAAVDVASFEDRAVSFAPKRALKFPASFAAITDSDV